MIWAPEKADPAVGSFMPALRWAVEHTEGPLLELGAGYFSTSYLAGLDRKSVSYEFDPAWIDVVRREFPQQWVVDRFSDIPEWEWAVVLVDCEGWKRQEFFDRLNPLIFVVHDSQDPWIAEESFSRYRFRHDLDESPRTTLLSNTVDVRECGL